MDKPIPPRQLVEFLQMHSARANEYLTVSNPAVLTKAAQTIERLTAALEKIANAPVWVGSHPDYGQGHDAARESAAEIANEALGIRK